jgi:hypothetical protein
MALDLIKIFLLPRTSKKSWVRACIYQKMFLFLVYIKLYAMITNNLRHIIFRPVLVAALVFVTATNLFAQTVIGPSDVYVSKQMPAVTNILSGGLPAYAEEGRVLKITIYNIQGPISFNQQVFNLTGPPCPTYTAHGQRIPANPLPSATANFNGAVSVPQANIPAAGTSMPAAFSVRDEGYWTKCSQNLQVQYAQTVRVNLTINSLKLAMATHSTSVCEGASTHVDISQRFPATGGTVTYASVNGKVNVSDLGNGFMMTYVGTGDDMVVCTLSAGSVTYKDTVKVKVGKLAFAQARYNYICPVNSNIDLKSLLVPGSLQNNLAFTGSLNGAAAAPLAATINRNAYAPGDILTVKVKSTDNAACEATTEIRFFGLDIVIPNATACDGAALPFSADITPRDNTVRVALLGTVVGLVPAYTLAVPSLGNPLGNTTLTFPAFNATFNSQVNNMIWYANIATECNNLGTYNLRVRGTIGGQAVQSVARPINADVNGGTCCNGAAGPTQSFVGAPTINTRANPAGAGFEGFVANWAPYRRTMLASSTNICLATSQWRALVQAEETYHVGQITGANGVLGALQFIRANVVAAVNAGGPYIAGTAANANTVCWNAFVAAENAEIARSVAMYAYPGAHRCAMERQAKAAAGIAFRFKMACAYPACP